MLHLPNNIKIIRSLSGKTQEDFRKEFTNVTLAMQKSYEGAKAEPDSLYLQELSEISGVPIKDLTGKEINKNNVRLKVEKVEKISHGNIQEPEGSYSERSLTNLTESNKVLAEANKTLAEANKTLAEANHVISKNHDELIQLTKMIVAANSSASRQAVPVPAGQYTDDDKPVEDFLPKGTDLSVKNQKSGKSVAKSK